VHRADGVDGCVVTIVTGDRVDVLAAAAGALGTLRVGVRSARAWTQGVHAVSQWHIDDPHVDVALLRHRVESVLDGRLDPVGRLGHSAGRGPDPSVVVRPDASASATVLEVRAQDRPGVVHHVCRALADIGVAVRSAHVATFGPQAVDVFYLQEEGAGVLRDERSAEAAHAVRRALTAPVTLDP
jgi:[protein-PII] uridylyltransferase